jgi:hypothetical protein
LRGMPILVIRLQRSYKKSELHIRQSMLYFNWNSLFT